MVNIHVDIDNLWIYEKEYGISFGKDTNYIFHNTLPYILKLFEYYDIKATFFILGKDLELESARNFCNTAIKAGHALGNHTYNHRADFNRLSFEEKQYEIKKCHEAIINTTGQNPLGFRAPGYYLDCEIIDILSNLGYKYDSSILPSFVHYLMNFHMARASQAVEKKTFGRRRYLLVSRKPCIIQGATKAFSIYEFPISVLPFFRTPTHPTFLFLLGRAYFRLMKMLYTISPKNHIYLFHVIDFMDLPNAQEFANSIVTFRRSFNERARFIEEILSFLKKLSGGSIETTESQLGRLSKTKIPKSFLLSRNFKPYSKVKNRI